MMLSEQVAIAFARMRMATFRRVPRSTRGTAFGLSQEAFAERSGHHRTFVGAIQRGQMNVSLIGLARIAEALGCQAEDLVAAAEGRTTESHIA